MANARLRTCFSSPSCIRYSLPYGDFLVWQAFGDTLLLKSNAVEMIEQCERLLGEFTAAYICNQRNEITIWRSISSGFPIFYTCDEGKYFISDKYSECCTKINSRAFNPSDDAVIDHFAYGSPQGSLTYNREIMQLPRGQRISFPTNKTGDKYQDFEKSISSWRGYYHTIDDFFQDLSHELELKQCSLLFSGGLDSTAMATLLPDVKLHTNHLDADEYVKEIQRSRYAASILNRPVDVFTLTPDVFLTEVDEYLRKMHQPPDIPQSILHFRGFRESSSHSFISGKMADSLFSFPARSTRTFYEEIKNFRRFFKKLESKTSTQKLVNDIFGSSNLMRRESYRLEIAEDMLGGQSTRTEFVDKALASHLFNDGLTLWRREAEEVGKVLYNPFSDLRVIAFAADSFYSPKVSLADSDKPVIADVIKRNAYEYDISMRKLGGVIRPSFVTRELGSAMDFFPDFVDKKVADEITLNSQKLFWRCFFFGRSQQV